MKRSLKIALSILALMNLFFSGCSSNSEQERQAIRELPQSDPLVMIIKNRADTTSTITSGQLGQSFDYTKIPYATLDLGLLSEEQLNIPESVRLVCLATSEIQQLSDQDVEKLVRFVAEGNALLTTTPVWDERFGYLLGIRPQADYRQQLKADGFTFHQLAFPDFTNDSFKQPVPYYHRGFDKSVFSDNIEVIASSKDSLETPVLLEKEIGYGQSAFFNSQIGFEKDYRGLLFSMALKMLEGVAYPIANASTIFLDDFPAPLYNEKMSPIDWEYDISHAQFVTKVWWPDMQKLADKYHIDYSAMIAFNYNANVVPPFDFEEWTMNEINIPGEEYRGSIGLAEDVKESRHELGFHGYNHFSLWLEDWPNEEFMISSLQAARKRWRIDNLGELPVTYVPPTNLIDSTGIQALTKGMPQVKYMSSLYIGTPEDGTGREFGPDPYSSKLFDYPRITSGFIADDNSMFKQQSLYLLSGVWTHFVHPDDVFQINQSEEDIFPSRNERGLGWHRNRELDYGLYEVFETRIRETIRDYPYIRFKTAKDAAPIVKDWTQTQTYRSNTQNQRQVVYNLNSVQQRRGVEYNPSYWFMYVTEGNRNQVEEALSPQIQQLTFTRIWDGYLAQFSTYRDTLNIPHLNREGMTQNENRDAVISSALTDYRNYPGTEGQAGDADTSWTDTRLEDALKQLDNNPQNQQFQEQVITLAVESNKLDLAISLLEKRLLTSEVWSSNDIERLVTYYGWAGKTGQAWSLLETLWQTHQDQSVIALKDLMVAQYGFPDTEFRQQWLKRELKVNPGDEQVLKQLVRSTQSQETWPQTKDYLERMIALNPGSDSLYHYSLQRSLWYGQPDSTVQWLNSFPPSAEQQLQPLAEQIANLFAYQMGNYDQALVWADKTDAISTQTRLQWLQQADRQQDFQQQAVEEVQDQAENDSLRAFVGIEFIYSGRQQLGYEILYPLFEGNKAPDNAVELIHTEIGYMSYEQKKQTYRQYPAFFTDQMASDLQQQYRTTEGVASSLRSSYAGDNFNNNLAQIELTTEWGNRNQSIHTVTAGRSMVQSDLNTTSLSDQLTSLNYTYQQKYRQQSMQSTIGAGISTAGGEVLPELTAGFWFAGADSTFTSAQLTYSPVMTNRAISQNINRIRSTIYREDYWLRKGRLMTTFSGTANWYTDNVFSYEGLARFYVQLPFSTSVIRSRVIGEVGYLNATTSYSSGIPYWTPDGLFVKGAGLDLRYQTSTQNPTFSVEAELLGKHNNDGFYLSTSARLNARIHRYWQLSLNTELSSSDLYRYNNVGFTLRYNFPRVLTAEP